MKTYTFYFYKNTPFTDLVNTVHFKNNFDRDAWFAINYSPTQIRGVGYNHIRDRGIVRFQCKNFYDFLGVNYGAYSDGDFVTYFYVNNVNYNNDNTITVELMVDVIMTYFQGVELFNKFKNLSIQRQHLSREEYKNRQLNLRTNDDILKTNTKRYVLQKFHEFQYMYVLFQCSVDLQSDFGDKDNPNIVTSDGIIFDSIVSPVNLYAVQLDIFNKLINELSDYPWISQNIKKVIIVPLEFIGENNLEEITVMDTPLYKLKNKGKSSDILLDSLTTDYREFYSTFGLDWEEDIHLFRSEYVTIELFTWDGQSLNLNPPFLPENKLEMLAKSIYGHENEIRIFPLNYKSDIEKENEITRDGNPIIYKGDFLNNSIVLNTFTELPLLIDNAILSQANSANQRALSESQLFTNRIDNVFDSNSSIESKFFDAMSIVSNVSLSGIGSKLTDEYEYYRRQKAEIADLAIAPPTITNQTKGNAFQLANNIYGVSLKLSCINDVEMKDVKRYYKLFGYEINGVEDKLENVESMTICNYIQFKGNIMIPDIPTEYLNIAKVQFENGLRLWHPNGYKNPLEQDIFNNKIRS